MHHNRHAKSLCQLAGAGKMVSMGVGIDQVAYAQPVARGERKVMIELADFGVDQRCCAGLPAADEIRLATARGDLFEDHAVLPEREEYPTRRAS